MTGRTEVIVSLLEERPYRARELADLFAINLAEAQHHLVTLQEAGAIYQLPTLHWTLVDPSAPPPPAPPVRPMGRPRNRRMLPPDPERDAVTAADLERWYQREDESRTPPSPAARVIRTRTIDGVDYDVIFDGT